MFWAKEKRPLKTVPIGTEASAVTGEGVWGMVQHHLTLGAQHVVDGTHLMAIDVVQHN